ncbi:MAG: UTP--glucose-1-phosphate uridylyltransferase [Planctomycetota bacterium]
MEGDARQRLVRALASVDLEQIEDLRRLVLEPGPTVVASRFEPPELFPLERNAEQEARAERAIERGNDLFRTGQVAFVLVAGGQASRLGFDGPKGNFPVGPVTGRTLFHLHARRLLRVAALGGPQPAWYVMTSAANDLATRDAFEAEDHFGFEPENVFFFQQEMLPALDGEGRILFQAPDQPFLAPNGHGGVLWALRTSGALADMRRRGLTQLAYFQVDNPLVRPVDPLFLGLHAEAGAEMSSKVVEKVDPDEKVGVLGRADGVLGCIEYSDLPAELREARDPNGKLRFRAGNIAVHVLTVDFVERLTANGLDLPWHVANKEMTTVAPGGEAQVTAGHKFETFVFDALGRAERSVTLEVDRALEFSPVKNREGSDSPATAKRDMCQLYADWARGRDIELPPADGAGDVRVEVDPLLAETREEFLTVDEVQLDEHDGGLFLG